MKHIRHHRERAKARCLAPLRDDDSLVQAAMHSDCNECRAAVGVAPVDQRGCGVTSPPVYEPQPDADAEDAVATAMRRRDGR